MTTKRNPQVTKNDVAIQLVTVSIERDEIPRILQERGITADKLVAWAYADQKGESVRLCYTTGRLPQTHECQVKVSVDENPAMLVWDKYDGALEVFTTFNQGDLKVQDFVRDVRQMHLLKRPDGQPATYVDTVVPLRDLAQTKQYVRIDGKSICLNPNAHGALGITMVRIDRVNDKLLALATDKFGKARRIVSFDIKSHRHDPTKLQDPEAWYTVMETDKSMMFYSRPDNQGLETQVAVNFEDQTARKLVVDNSVGNAMARWEGDSIRIGYYVVGHLSGHHETIVGYAHKIGQEVDLRFAPRSGDAPFMARN
jgi:hypothetical protein